MSQRKDEKPDPAAHEQKSEPYLPEQLFTSHAKKQLHPKAAGAAAAGLIYVVGEILEGANQQRAMADAAEEGGREIQPRHVDAAIRSDSELRRLLSAWVLDRTPAPRSGAQPAQQPVPNTPDGAIDHSIDRLMSAITPDETVSVSPSARSILVGLLALLIEQLMDAADVISTRTNSDVIYKEDVRAALKVILTGEMRQLADREIGSMTA